MGIRQKVEESPTVWLLGVLLTGFLAGLATYQWVLEIAQLKVVPNSSELVTLAKRSDALEQELAAAEEETRKLKAGDQSSTEIQLLRRKIDELQASTLRLEKQNQSLRRDLNRTKSTEISPSQADEPALTSDDPEKKQPSTRRSIVVQVFSSPVESQAQERVDLLTQLGHRAFLSPVDVAGRTIYRVRVGPFADRESASRSAERIRREAHLDTWLTESQ